MIRKSSKLGLMKVRAEEQNKKTTGEITQMTNTTQTTMEQPKKKLPQKKKEVTKKKPSDYEKLAEERVLRITDGTSLVFSISKTKDGDPHVDIRTHVHTDKYDGPTKRGVNFNIEFLEDFRHILEIIDEELAEKGI